VAGTPYTGLPLLEGFGGQALTIEAYAKL